MCAVLKKRICGKKLICCKVVTLNATFPRSEYILITGKVLSPFNKPLANAAITVFSIDGRYTPHKKKYIGVTFSNEHGVYGMSIPRNLEVSYELKAYSYIMDTQ